MKYVLRKPFRNINGNISLIFCRLYNTHNVFFEVYIQSNSTNLKFILHIVATQRRNLFT